MITRYCIIVIAAFLILGACEKEPKKKVRLPNKVAIKADTTLVTVEPDEQLYAALVDFINEKTDQCAKDIRTANYFMRPLAAKGGIDPDRKLAIEKAIDTLDELAKKVSANQVEDLSTLNSVFGQIGLALGEYRLWIIAHEYVNRDVSESGMLLDRTIAQLERSVKTHDRALSKEEKVILDHGRDLAKQLKTGNKVSEAKLRKAVADIDYEIARWDKEFSKTK